MKNKTVVLLLFFCIALSLAGCGRDTLGDVIESSTITKLEYHPNDNNQLVTDSGEIDYFISIFNNIDLEKADSDVTPPAGGDFSIDIYHENGNHDQLTVGSYVYINGTAYVCEKIDEIKDKLYSFFASDNNK
ncbi:MAG: hypothetical protein K5639_08155 [Eubacterium sp.]|nr:hypothetical protein [Eubacterium sp.]